MTPGLALFYGGFDRKENAVNLILQNMLAIGVSTVLWITIGYSLCFSGDTFGVIGNLDKIFLQDINATSLFEETKIPLFVFISYQMMFAIITPALMTGAFTRRMNTGAYILFISLWQIFIYYPFVHMVWGGGLLSQIGVLDFAGGIVVHVSAGCGALAAVFFLGKRAKQDFIIHSLPIVVLGTAMLWFGWFGFNSGSALAANEIASLALINSQIAAAFGAVVWFIINWLTTGKPQLSAFCIGSIAGLATITPCAGFISPQSSMAVGIIAGGFCYLCVSLLKSRKFDDALDVFGVHGLGGGLGTILLGVFASRSVNPSGADGLIYGNLAFFMNQVAAVLGCGLFALTVSLMLLKFVNAITTLKVSDGYQRKGVDATLHQEKAYNTH